MKHSRLIPALCFALSFSSSADAVRRTKKSAQPTDNSASRTDGGSRVGQSRIQEMFAKDRNVVLGIQGIRLAVHQTVTTRKPREAGGHLSLYFAKLASLAVEGLRKRKEGQQIEIPFAGAIRIGFENVGHLENFLREIGFSQEGIDAIVMLSKSPRQGEEYKIIVKSTGKVASTYPVSEEEFNNVILGHAVEAVKNTYAAMNLDKMTSTGLLN